MGTRTLRWAIVGSICALLAVPVTQEIAEANPQHRSSLSIATSAPKRTLAITSIRELNGHLAETLVVNYSSPFTQPLEVVVASVLIAPDGRRISECLSETSSIKAGAKQRLPAACRTGGFVTAQSGEALAASTLGAAVVINHEEQYSTDMRPLSVLGKAAAAQAKQRGAPVLAIGAFPVNNGRAEGMSLRMIGYPCVKY